jgi:hypothetical protein
MNRRRNSRAGKIRGIYHRGNIFWFARMEGGRRTQLSLGTSDYSEAVSKAAIVLQNPFLNESGPLDAEVTEFLDHKERQNERSYKRNETYFVLRLSRRTAQERDSATIGGKNPAAVLLGRRGGLKGGKARARALSPERRIEIAVAASKARWGRRSDA